MARKVVKITINHHNSGDHLSTTATTATTITTIATKTTETIPPGKYNIPQGRKTITRGMYA